jgi:hypothetical protein
MPFADGGWYADPEQHLDTRRNGGEVNIDGFLGDNIQI